MCWANHRCAVESPGQTLKPVAVVVGQSESDARLLAAATQMQRAESTVVVDRLDRSGSCVESI